MAVYIDLARNPRGVTIVAVLWSFIAFSGLTLVLRLYSKLTRSRRLWWDDHFIIVAWILLLVSCSTTTANTRLGFGLHADQVPLENLVQFSVQSNISGFASVIAVACSKTSFAITLLRLTDGWMRWFVIGLMVLLNVTHYISALFFWVSCNPPAKTYNPLLPGECWPISVTVNFSFFVGSCSAFCDFALALLPWRLLLRYDMYNREKIGVAICMSMGIIAGITCIVKMTTVPLLYRGDFSYNSLPLVLWGFMEPALTIVAASIPVLRHLFKAFRRGSSDDFNNTHTATTTTYTPSPTTSANMQNSAGGGTRASRLAAARADHHDRAGGAERGDGHGDGDSNNQQGKEKRGMAQVGGLGKPPPGYGGDKHDRVRQAGLGSSSTCTKGGSEGGSAGAPSGEKGGVGEKRGGY